MAASVPSTQALAASRKEKGAMGRAKKTRRCSYG
jgi:hypothetical protein